MILICDHRGTGLLGSLRPLRGAGFELESTHNLRETRARLREERLQLLVLDPLAAGGAVEIEELARLCGEEAATPILLVSDPDDPDAVLHSTEVLSSNIWDIIRRDAGIGEFSLRMQRLMSQSNQITELVDLRYRAAHDDLTDLLRPLYFQARLEEHYSAAERHGLDLSLVLIDLDNFGKVNKIFDHTVGDRVLIYVARAIRESLRTEDIAGRIGGDEFAIVLPYTGAIEAAATVSRLCNMISALSGTVDDSDVELSVRASLGFDSTNGRDVVSAMELRHHAETALRRAKHAGGNRGVFYRSQS